MGFGKKSDRSLTGIRRERLAKTLGVGGDIARKSIDAVFRGVTFNSTGRSGRQPAR